MRGEMYDLRVAECTLGRECLDSLVCGLLTEIDGRHRCPRGPRYRAQFIGRFGEWNLAADDLHIGQRTTEEPAHGGTYGSSCYARRHRGRGAALSTPSAPICAGRPRKKWIAEADEGLWCPA